ncbi:MAG: efflux RND transporter periplasmic adaptor subunit [bacterium]
MSVGKGKIITLIVLLILSLSAGGIAYLKLSNRLPFRTPNIPRLLKSIFERRERPPKTIAVDRGTIRATVQAAGTIEAASRFEIKSKIDGQIADVLVEPGRKVAEGDTLFLLDDWELKIEARLAEAALQSARVKVAQAESNLKLASINYDVAKEKYNTAKELFENDAITKQSLKNAENELKLAEEKLKAIREGELPGARATVSQAEIDLDLARERLSQAKILSPIAGVAIEVRAKRGEVIESSQILAIVADVSRMYAKVYVREEDIGKVRVDQRAEVRASAYPNITFAGKVVEIAYTPTIRREEATYETRIEIESADTEHPLRVGMATRAEIEVAPRDNVIRVPNPAIQGPRENPFVIVLKDGETQKRPVEIGPTDGNYTQIVKGVEEGEEVVIPSK